MYNKKHVEVKYIYIYKSNNLTLSIPNILGLLDEINDIDKSTMEMITRAPSIIFQPDVK